MSLMWGIVDTAPAVSPEIIAVALGVGVRLVLFPFVSGGFGLSVVSVLPSSAGLGYRYHVWVSAV